MLNKYDLLTYTHELNILGSCLISRTIYNVKFIIKMQKYCQ